MGLDWCVNIYKKGTYKQVEGNHHQLGYTGVNYLRGKIVAQLMREYDVDEGVMYGDYDIDRWGEEVGPFIHEDTDVEQINRVFDEIELVDLEEEHSMSIDDQKEALQELNDMVRDVNEYNESNKDYTARIWAWY